VSWNVLTKESWFEEGFEDGNHTWAAPPVITDAVMDNLCESVLVRPWNSHIFVCPALMTSKWRKQLRKVANFVVTIPVGSVLWNDLLHEPLVFALICLLLNYSPWQVRNIRGWAELSTALPKLWSPNWCAEGGRLRDFWCAEVPDDPDLLWGMTCKVLRTEAGGSIPGAEGEGFGRFNFRSNRSRR
jgi:hypothetical protein